jgi:hypothetical protein
MFRKILKIFGISLIAIMAFVGVVMLFAYRTTAPVAAVADGFMSEVSAGNTSAAYARLSDEVKKNTSPTGFNQMIQNAGLVGARDITWTNRSLNTKDGVGNGAIEGAATLANGKKIEIKMNFRQAAGVWLVDSFNTKQK